MEPTSVLVGIVGKTNTGKSTFFSAATEIAVPIENRPFVTIDPNVGVTYARKPCVHTELGLPGCDAANSLCRRGQRFIPVKIIDVAGLVPGAHQGRGLGNRFLDHVRRADVLLLVVDASGSTDEEGRPVKPGSYDPVEEVRQMTFEFEEWLFSIIAKDWERIARQLDTAVAADAAGTISQRLSGLGVTKRQVADAIRLSGLDNKRFSSWSREELRAFASRLRELSKPLVIVANKVDVSPAEENVKRLKEEYKGIPVVPASALSELALRRAASKGLIDYLPGDREFQVISQLPPEARKVLERVAELMRRWGSTGVQEAINVALFSSLSLIPVYPVEDQNKYTDKQGRVLPDVLLIPKGSSVRELAYRIHTELGDTFLYAINAKTKQRVGESYEVKENDVIKVVASGARR
ncbi:MAG: redox-regulated ATPase YchF [Acidilobaceae archaeon]|nr:redox-regulated ATPase YchF [Acidilobaceae archaeon]MCX8165146.1 redox-regulated ATPase YchF [Acidilobaceae archaeon]MDW7974338.1 redox-regulated ATPase YchF [Sulfolobales archaeon]